LISKIFLTKPQVQALLTSVTKMKNETMAVTEGHTMHEANPPQVPIFVLTIDSKGGARRENCTNLFSKVDCSFEFVEGLRGVDPLVDSQYSQTLNLLFGKRNMSSAEVAVYLGHRKAWSNFLNIDKEVALIVEDDLSILDYEAFKTVLSASHDNSPWDILKLFDFRPKKVVNQVDWYGLNIVDYKYPASGCVAYLITRRAAENLLKRKRLFRPVDEDLSWCWEHGIRVRSIYPNMVGEISEKIGGSTIEMTRLAEKRKRNLLRSLWGILVQAYKQVRAKRYHANLKR
jgi:GR25 family glycosyltransferase involved in LPS biosynthesis